MSKPWRKKTGALARVQAPADSEVTGARRARQERNNACIYVALK
jgi:hypothetical protein